MPRLNYKILVTYPREITMLALIVACTLAIPSFGDASNVKNLLGQAAPLLLLAIGQTFVLLIRAIDLTQGVMVGVSSVVLFVLFKDIGPVGAVGVVLLGSSALGAVSGALVAKARLDPLIGTLAGMYILTGILMFRTGGSPLTETPAISGDFLIWLGTSSVGFVPVSFIVACSLAVMAHIYLRHFVFGLHIYAMGSNPTAAIAQGINRILVFAVAYGICGLFTGGAAILLTARIHQGNPHLGEGLLFESIGSAVMGGVLLSGGIGGVWAAVRGVAIFALIQNALYLTDLNSHVRDVVLGVMIIVGVVIKAERPGDSA